MRDEVSPGIGDVLVLQRAKRWGCPLSPVYRSWPPIQGALEEADWQGWGGLLPPAEGRPRVGPRIPRDAGAHLVLRTLTLTGALGVDPQVRAELVGAHARMAPRLWQQVGLRGQMDEHEDKEQRQGWLWGRHGDHGARGWECVATSSDSLWASTL